MLARLAVAALLSLAASRGLAAGPGGPPPPQPVPLRLANRVIFEFRAEALGYPPHERAVGAQRRLEASLTPGAPGVVTTRPTSEGVLVEIDGKHVFFVTPGDVNGLADETPETAAATAAENLRHAIGEEREQTRPRYLLIAIALSLLASLVFVAALKGLASLDRWARRRLASAVAARARQVKVGGVHLLESHDVFWGAKQLFLALLGALALTLTYVWFTFVLERFPFTRPWGESLRFALVDLARDAGIAFGASLPGLFAVAVIAVMARFAAQTASSFFRRIETGGLQVGWLDAETARPTRRISLGLIWLFALAMAYPYLPGAQTEAFKALSVLVGLMVSIGSSNLVGQWVSGLILVYTRSLRPGDYVRVGPEEGTVVDVGTFATRVRTGMGEEVTLPNGVILTTTIRNYSRSVPGAGCVLDTAVTIGYATPWRQVHAMLMDAAVRTAGIATDPAPFVRQTALSDFYVEYRLVAYTSATLPLQRPEVLSRLHASVQDVFNENGVQIMSPHYLADPPDPQVVPRERWHAPPAPPPVSAPD
jgi:small-conductance mechanosensitive channel